VFETKRAVGGLESGAHLPARRRRMAHRRRSGVADWYPSGLGEFGRYRDADGVGHVGWAGAR
jgi:hypothetical protein